MRELNINEKCIVSGGSVIYGLDGTCHEIAPSDKIIVMATTLTPIAAFFAMRGALGSPLPRPLLYGLVIGGLGIQALSYVYMTYAASKYQPEGLCNL